MEPATAFWWTWMLSIVRPPSIDPPPPPSPKPLPPPPQAQAPSPPNNRRAPWVQKTGSHEKTLHPPCTKNPPAHHRSQVTSVGSVALAVATLQDLQRTFEMNFHMLMWRVCCVFAVMTQGTSAITAALFLLKRSLSGSSALFGYGFLVASNFYSAVLMILIGIVLHNGAPYLGGHGNTALYTTNFVVAYVSSFFYLALFGMVLAFKGRLVGVPPSALKTLHSNNMA